MLEKYQRLIPIYEEQGLMKLQRRHVLIVGLGGVGGFVVESLARTGIKSIDICDGDIIELSNFNRQIIAIDSNINVLKTEAFKKRIQEIDNEIKVNTYPFFIKENNIDEISFDNYDLVIDCIDDVEAKITLIKKCKEFNVEIISCMGTGNKSNPQKFKICDINQTYQCPLAKKVRTELKKLDIKNVKVCFSDEIPMKNEQRIIASQIFVVGSAGLLIASEAIKYLIALK